MSPLVVTFIAHALPLPSSSETILLSTVILPLSSFLISSVIFTSFVSVRAKRLSVISFVEDVFVAIIGYVLKKLDNIPSYAVAWAGGFIFDRRARTCFNSS